MIGQHFQTRNDWLALSRFRPARADFHLLQLAAQGARQGKKYSATEAGTLKSTFEVFLVKGPPMFGAPAKLDQ